ncbi:hypothetical protein [Herminiimonas contaminans]|uniref:Uncharacterized protein n=1 Tax=Herminiimonas contaminans TaxID=1111140 RepID=A0ABS0EVS6_9BURK|nr:hypothetical protein [Herminiimonas contaminans]MBF8178945.1 hypothetical protein [Herminiimonas contaminans]
MKKILIALLGTMVMASASAKLPPLSDEAKAKAAEAKNKAGWSDKVAAYQLCESQNKVAAQYFKRTGKAKPDIVVPPCTNPGPYVALQVATSTVGVADSKPVPAAGAKK